MQLVAQFVYLYNMIDIKFGNLFPGHFRFLAVIGLIGAVGIFPFSYIGAILLFLVCFFVLFSSEGTEVNPANATLREYTSFLLFKTGKFRSYGQPEKIFITKSKESQQVHTAHTNHSSTYDKEFFTGFLKLASGEKIQLLRESDKDQLIKKLSPLSDGLKVEIVDHS